LATPADKEQPPWQAPVVDIASEVAVDALQPVGVEPDLGGIDLDLDVSHRHQPCRKPTAVGGGPTAGPAPAGRPPPARGPRARRRRRAGRRSAVRRPSNGEEARWRAGR